MDTPAFIVPLEVTLNLDQTTLVVKPASVKQLAQVLSVSRPAVRAVLEVRDVLARRRAAPAAADDELDMAVAGMVLTSDDVVDIYTALAQHPDALMDMVAILTGMPAAAVGALLPDRFVYLFATVLQVNVDFFFRAAPVFAAARRALEGLQPTQATPGNAPSAS